MMLRARHLHRAIPSAMLTENFPTRFALTSRNERWKSVLGKNPLDNRVLWTYDEERGVTLHFREEPPK